MVFISRDEVVFDLLFGLQKRRTVAAILGDPWHLVFWGLTSGRVARICAWRIRRSGSLQECSVLTKKTNWVGKGKDLVYSCLLIVAIFFICGSIMFPNILMFFFSNGLKPIWTNQLMLLRTFGIAWSHPVSYETVTPRPDETGFQQSFPCRTLWPNRSLSETVEMSAVFFSIAKGDTNVYNSLQMFMLNLFDSSFLRISTWLPSFPW